MPPSSRPRPLPLVTLAVVLSLLCHAAPAEYLTTELQGPLPLPPSLRPTSALALVPCGHVVHVLYRGPSLQLVHATLSDSLSLLSFSDLGGILSAAPSAVLTSYTYSDNPPCPIDVAYPNTHNVVTLRHYRNSSWSVALPLTSAPRTAHAVSLAPTESNDGKTLLFLTTPNKRLVVLTQRAGFVTKRPKWIRGQFVNGAPAALNTHISSLGVQVFVRNLFDVVVMYDVKKAKFSRVPHVGRSTTPVCAASIGEGGQIVVGVSEAGKPKGVKLFREYDVAEQWTMSDDQGWAEYAPACAYWKDSCTIVAVTGTKTMYELYCN